MWFILIILLLIESSNDTGWYHYGPAPSPHIVQQPYGIFTGICQSVCTVY